MFRSISRSEKAGFALIEAMVALLLLAVVMLGAVAAVTESLAGQRGALLQIQAADLAGNLAEALRSAPDKAAIAAEVQSWQTAARQVLPLADALALPRLPSHGASGVLAAAGFDIQLQWRDGRTSLPTRLSLPLGLNDLQTAK